MTEYFDRLKCPLGADGKRSENFIEFAAIYYALNPGVYTDDEIIAIYFDYFCCSEVYSHDNNTGCLFFVEDLNWRQLWAYIKNFPFGTIRDLCYYLNCKWPILFYPLRLPLSIIMCWSHLPGPKWSPWFLKRKWIEWFYEPNPFNERYVGGEDYKIWYYKKKIMNDTVVEFHKFSLDANLLNILRVSRLQMRWTAACLKYINNDLYKICLVYFKGDVTHPIVASSKGMGYMDLING